MQVAYMNMYNRTIVWHRIIWIHNPHASCSYQSWMMAVTLLFVLQFLDLLTTKLVLDCGGVELNPFYHMFQNSPWFWAIMTIMKIVFLSYAYVSLSIADRKYPMAAWITFLILILQAIGVVFNNNLVLFTLL